MLNVFDIAMPEERVDIPDRAAYVIEPARAYPAALADMTDALDNIGSLPSALQSIITPVRDLLTPERIALTEKSLDEIDNANARVERARLLEAARLWFTEKLHAALNFKPLNLHILKDERYRL